MAKKGERKVDEGGPSVLGGQPCPVCHKKTLTLTEAQRDVPYFGRVYLMSMTCNSCNYHQADVMSEEGNDPVKYTIEIQGDDDLKVRIVKSSQATVKIPHIMTITPGPASNGYVTNVEGILNRVKHQIETARDNDEDPAARKKAKNLLKKLQRVTWGKDKLKIIIEDPSGNSAIISEKAVKGKL